MEKRYKRKLGERQKQIRMRQTDKSELSEIYCVGKAGGNRCANAGVPAVRTPVVLMQGTLPLRKGRIRKRNNRIIVLFAP
jgi:hypothetical protein